MGTKGYIIYRSMKILKNFKSFSISESTSRDIANWEMTYKTFFAVPKGSVAYGRMEFELTPISMDMPDMDGSEPIEFENHNSIPIICDSEAYGEIFIATFYTHPGYKCEIDVRDTDDTDAPEEDEEYGDYPTETIEYVVKDVRKNTDNLVAFYHLKNEEDEYNFDLTDSMLKSMETDPLEVAKSLLGCKDYIRDDFMEKLNTSDISISLNVSHSSLTNLRKKFPEIFKIINDRTGDGAETSADLGELGF